MSITKDYILSVGAGTNQVPLILKIKEMGWKVISCDADINAPGKLYSDIFINVSTYDWMSIIDAIEKENINLVAALTRSTGQPVATCSRIAHHFNLLGLDTCNSNTLIHKQKLLNKLHSYNIPAPKLYHINDIINSPVFIKPANTVLSHSAMQLCHTKLDIQKAYENAAAVSVDGTVNIEEYLIGQDIVSIDFVYKGKVIHLCTIGEISMGPPSFDGIGWYSVSDTIDKIAKEQFKTLKNALKIKHGFFQTAMKYDPLNNNCKIYEVHAEIGGDKVNDIFIPLIGQGYDVFENNINLAVGICPKKMKIVETPTLLFFSDKISKYNIQIEELKATDYKEFDDVLVIQFKEDIMLRNFLSRNCLNFSFSTGVNK